VFPPLHPSDAKLGHRSIAGPARFLQQNGWLHTSARTIPVPELMELGDLAAKAGFRALATSDHLQPWQANEGHAGEAWVTLGALGVRAIQKLDGHHGDVSVVSLQSGLGERRVHLSQLALSGTNFSRPWIRRGVERAGRDRRLGEIAGTLGSSHRGRRHHPSIVDRSAGRHYQVDARLYDLPAQPIPLMMAADGKNSMRRAGQHGDGLVTDPHTWQQHRSEWQAGARAAGKNPDDMPVLVERYVVVGGAAESKQAAGGGSGRKPSSLFTTSPTRPRSSARLRRRRRWIR
jgi:F420-dependent hydroxymycolic acid dehydrogenase